MDVVVSGNNGLYRAHTMLALEAEAGIHGFHARAGRCIDFLLNVQLDSGAFPGLEIADNRVEPSVFNTAQILNGLTAWHRSTGAPSALGAAQRAAEWMIGQQDSDGAWRRHLYGSGRTYTYMAHAGCWLAEFGAHLGDQRYLRAARRHLEWVLTHVDETTGWINDCGFENAEGERRAVTHTIAYTIWGVLVMSTLLGDERGLEVARRSTRAVARRLELSKWLPGELNADWKGVAAFECLTGTAQMALIWFELHRLENDPALVNAACRAVDRLRRAQPVYNRDPGIRGGMPGSDPVWGGYMHLALPNWAVKFYIDALLAKARTLPAFPPLPCTARGIPTEVPRRVPTTLAADDGLARQRPRVVLIADEHSHKVQQFCESWSSWGFEPDAVVVRRIESVPPSRRIANYVRHYGLTGLARRVVRRRPSGLAGPEGAEKTRWPRTSVSAYCVSRGLRMIMVSSFEKTADVQIVQSFTPDLIVYAGGGIIRPAMLGIARLGILNAHMGLLPTVRGMNATEWSAFMGVPIGCTVHLIDTGIDTGPILLFQPASVAAAESIAALRGQVDDVQVDALGRVVRWVLEHGELPRAYVQAPDEGQQFFEMHPALRTMLEERLRAGPGIGS